MKIIRKASEDETVLAFLSGEIRSERFGGELRSALIKTGLDENIILNADLSSLSENNDRKRLLGEFRGYPDREIFENYPENIDWVYVAFSEADLGKMRYIDYSYWNELSRGTSEPFEAAKTVREGTEIFGVSNERFLKAAAALENVKFPPVIVLCRGETFLCLEGHLRLTAYALNPKRFEGSFGYVGICSAEDMR